MPTTSRPCCVGKETSHSASCSGTISSGSPVSSASSRTGTLLVAFLHSRRQMGSECARLEHPAKRVRSKTNSHRTEIAVRNSQQIQPATTPKRPSESPATLITYPVGRLSNARILRLKQVVTTVGLAKSSIYRKIQIGTFPPPIKLGGARASGWLSTEVLEWIEDQVRRRPKA